MEASLGTGNPVSNTKQTKSGTGVLLSSQHAEGGGSRFEKFKVILRPTEAGMSYVYKSKLLRVFKENLNPGLEIRHTAQW